ELAHFFVPDWLGLMACDVVLIPRDCYNSWHTVRSPNPIACNRFDPKNTREIFTE
ncbi:hypothetical protein L9F63_027857, partial [Diploptera punctata]